MTNAELFKKTFGIYSEEFWSYTEKQMLDWINADVPGKNVGDMISRQGAIEAFIKDWEGCISEYDAREILNNDIRVLTELPSAEQQRKKGKWVDKKYRWIDSISMWWSDSYECSVCRDAGIKYWNFCPNCGAEMVKEAEEDE